MFSSSLEIKKAARWIWKARVRLNIRWENIAFQNLSTHWIKIMVKRDLKTACVYNFYIEDISINASLRVFSTWKARVYV